MARFGEWERVSQAAMPLHVGGAYLVTKQAAVELQVLLDMKRQGFDVSIDAARRRDFRSVVERYVPSESIVDATLNTFSSTYGNNYGSTSAAAQMRTLARATAARTRLHLLHEVEWVQLERSHIMTRFAIEHPAIRLGGAGQLSITLLFGFSPSFPFPRTYGEFRAAVARARELELDLDGNSVRTVSVSVGAAVIPQHADRHFLPVDVGPWHGRRCSAATRLAIYAAQPDSGIDIVRTRMEDTPFTVEDDGTLTVCDNLRLVTRCRSVLEEHGVRIIEDGREIRDRIGLTEVQSQFARAPIDSNIPDEPPESGGDSVVSV